MASVQYVVPAFESEVTILGELQQLDAVGRGRRDVGVNLLAVSAVPVKRKSTDAVQFVSHRRERRPVVRVSLEAIGLDEPAAADKADVSVSIGPVFLSRGDVIDSAAPFGFSPSPCI